MIAAMLIAGMIFANEPPPTTMDTLMIVDTLYTNRAGVMVTDTSLYEVRPLDGDLAGLKKDTKLLKRLLKARKGE